MRHFTGFIIFTSNVASRFLTLQNTAMHKVSDTTTYEMVHARVRGLLAIIKNRIFKLKVHSQAVSATRSDVAAETATAQGTSGHRAIDALHNTC